MRILRNRTQQRGAATVELAITTVVLVPLILWAFWFVDLIRVKLKTQEIARFAAWEFTAYPLSDYDGDNHAGAFAQARNSITARVNQLYGSSNLDAYPVLKGKMSEKPVYLALKINKLNFSFANETMAMDTTSTGTAQNHDESGNASSEQSGILGKLGSITGQLTKASSAIASGFHFNTDYGRAKASISIDVKNFGVAVPKTFVKGDKGLKYQSGYQKAGGIDISTSMVMTESMSLMADSWRLEGNQSPDDQGRAIESVGNAFAHETAEAAMAKEVNHIAFLGIFNSSVLANVQSVLDKAQGFLDSPFDTRRVASRPYGNAAGDGQVHLTTDDTDDAHKRFHTAPYQGNLGYTQQYARRRNAYMSDGARFPAMPYKDSPSGE